MVTIIFDRTITAEDLKIINMVVQSGWKIILISATGARTVLP